ncbi:MAG: TRAP transporter large permease [Alphaproteobacteria bacterium]|nr:TRAP transporter large permease [Alphaproteobacteria bacterium]
MDASFLVLGGFALLFLLGFPVVVAVLIPSVLYVLWEGIPLAMVGQRTVYALDSFPLMAVPIFIFVGNLMNSAGITTRIYRFADTAFGRLPGGLAQVNIAGSLIFSGMSGAALADVGGLGRVELKAMKEHGFNPAFASALTCASAIVGPIFPPSIPLIIYASVAGVSSIQLLLAGIGPALVCVAMLSITVAILGIVNNYPRAARWPTAGEAWRSFLPAAPALFTPILLIGGMLLGFFTPTEAAAVTAVYILFISAVIYREFDARHVFQAAVETIKGTAAIMAIVAVAAMFGWILAVEQIPQWFNQWVTGISKDPVVLLLILNLILFVAGMFVDSTTATLLLVPIVCPPLVAAGVDPIQLGLVVIFNLMIGLVTPPMGLSLFLMSDIAGVPIPAILRAMIPFYPPLLITLAIITFVPQVSLWIPSLLK